MQPRPPAQIGPVTLAVASACAAGLAGVAYARLGFFGLGLVGLIALVICERIDLEADGPTGSINTPELYAQLRAAEGGSADPRRQGERRQLRTTLRMVRVGAAALTAIGAIGFFMVQIR